MRIYLIPLITLLFFTACKNDTPTIKIPAVNEALDKYNATPSKETASAALEVIASEIKKNTEDKTLVKNLSEQALEISTNTKLTSKQISYLLLLLKEYPEDEEAKNRLLALADIMSSINKKKAANVLYNGVVNRFADSDAAEQAKQKMSSEAANIDEYLTKIGEEVFETPDKYGVNRKSAQSYVDACEAYALAYPGTAKAPEYLYKGTEVSRTLRTFNKSLTMYDWILKDYPQYEKAPTAMFLKGFIVENELKNDELAKTVYQEFLQRYPDHQLVDDVNFLLENVGKSDEEIMKMIEQNKKEVN